MNSDTLHINPISSSLISNYYRCRVINGTCTNYSDTVRLFICDPGIVSQPFSPSVDAGNTIYLYAKASSPSASYQWLQNTGNGFINLSNAGRFSGTDKDSLVINKVDLNDASTLFRCKITDQSCSELSDIVKLNIVCKLSFIHDPLNVISVIDSLASFIAISNSITANYQWQQNSGTGFFNLSDFGKYFGSNSRKLTISNLSMNENNYYFRCIVTDWGCYDTSITVRLNVAKDLRSYTVIESSSPAAELVLYPNPVQDYLNIKCGFDFTNYYYLITDNTGKNLYYGDINNNEVKLNLTTINPGFYLLYIRNRKSQNFHVYKIIKN